jgi:NAD(P)-dependent dehydrogenase (short-subunit alcohol dehydrogenase family)
MTTRSTRTAIVTGASGGTGRAVATKLARDGFAIAVNYAGNPAKAQEVVADIKVAGGEAFAIAAGLADQVLKGFASIVPPEADVSAVSAAIVKVDGAPFGKRPLRVHIDPTQDGAEVVNAVSDRVRAELLRRIGLGDLLIPRALAP